MTVCAHRPDEETGFFTPCNPLHVWPRGGGRARRPGAGTHRTRPGGGPDVTAPTCRCGRPVQGATLCDRCTHTADIALANIAAHYTDLDTLRTKRFRYTTTGATKSSSGMTRPLLVDLRFVPASNATNRDEWQVPGREGQGSLVVADLRTSITTWTRAALTEWPPLAPILCDDALCRRCNPLAAETAHRRPPRDTVVSCCGYLQRLLPRIAGQPWADVMLRDLLRLEQALARLVDRPPDRWYAGKCSTPDPEDPGRVVCQAELYAETESGTVRCPACGTVHDVTGRRDFLLVEAREYQVTATEAAGALIAWTDYDGSPEKLVDLIRKWRDRQRLEVQDVTSLLGKDRHLYRLGDVQELLVEHAQREQQRRIGRVG